MKAAKKLDERSKLLGQIRQSMRHWARAREEVKRASATLYSSTYAWVVTTMSMEGIGMLDAAKRLSATLRVKQHNVLGWYYAGEEMAAWNADPRKVDGGAFALIRKKRDGLSKYQLHRAATAALNAEDTRDVRRIIAANYTPTALALHRKATAAAKGGKLTQTYLRAQILALRALFMRKEKAEDIGDVVCIVLTRDGREIERSGELAEDVTVTAG